MNTAIVVGGTAGAGRAIVEKLLTYGYRVGVIARGEDRLDALSEKALGLEVAQADVASMEALRKATDDLVARIGVPDVWINVAMATMFARFEEMSAAEFERVMDVTFLGQVNATREALRHMQSGKIIFLGSSLAYRPVPLQSACSGAKHALNGFVGSLRSELMREGSDVTLHLVQLPAINTPQFDWARSRLRRKPRPAAPVFSPDVPAEAVMKIIRTGARELFVGRSVLRLVFGTLVLPAYLDRRMADEGLEAQKSDIQASPQEGNLFDPVAYPPAADGSYGDEAEDHTVMVDADLARKLMFFGLPALAFLLGLLF
ncbi:SDR family oxidoreductase [Celeribacter indicus]|uniref:Short-chain dehydrogenase/reductase SDR n=1 Tax=Celeribacter indicus TaxID=1208324 RepID=A0A0B5DZJ1_9RHOB|nr:SDR family oxidoreductase [Celeribacter indicus]AJE48873.1 short-chain dehydrogenase/reductase SDR [Celeribacter indicus]SDW39844.1 Short-chain dehydrogenase [Celeribacter indicus]